jgi:hypothetical protein
MNKIELVFRSVGERTASLALELAKQNLGPTRVHIINDVKPFWKAFQQNLEIEFDCDYVVFMDADCLILEDMRPFLQTVTDAYVDSYVLDKFRGRLHAGVHITRMDVVEAMRHVNIPIDHPSYLLRPESYTRMYALRALDEDKTIRNFRILHDFGQSYEHIFAKYLLRELRSRDDYERARLAVCMADWPDNDPDFDVAWAAIDYGRYRLTADNGSFDLDTIISQIPQIAREQVSAMGLPPKPPLTWEEIENDANLPTVLQKFDLSRKVFGIGLSRTGTKSLTRALNTLGYVMVHYPTDPLTYLELSSGHYHLTLLDHIDGIADITVAPFYAQLDTLFPDSKFILTVRDKESWLHSLERHWEGKPIYDNIPDQEDVLRMKRFLRAAVYGTFQINSDRLKYVYDLHMKQVLDYFKDRPDKLLIMDIASGDGWEPLCSFLGKPIPNAPFPNVQTKVKLREMLSRAV